MIPRGVHGTKHLPPVSSRPAFTGWNPSTSLSGEIASITRDSLIWPGRGSWTRIPWTAGSAFSSATRARRSFSGRVAGRSIWRESMPASWQAFPLFRTYTREAGSSPTSTAARHGLIPVRAENPPTLSRISAPTTAPIAFPGRGARRSLRIVRVVGRVKAGPLEDKGPRRHHLFQLSPAGRELPKGGGLHPLDLFPHSVALPALVFVNRQGNFSFDKGGRPAR